MIAPIHPSADNISRYPLLAPDAPRRVVLVGDDGAVKDRLGKLKEHAPEVAPTNVEPVPMAYQHEGVSQIPVPVFRWKRGQKIDQTLLNLQMHLYERIVKAAPASFHTLIAPAGAYIRMTDNFPAIPEADIVCFGLWVDTEQATKSRVFCVSRQQPQKPEMLLSNPSIEQLQQLTGTHLVLMDAGLWLLNDRARQAVAERPLGQLLDTLNVVVLPLAGAEFYPFTTTREMVDSCTALQNAVQDQRLILQRNLKAIPSLFTQNARVETKLTEANSNIWIENSHVPASWTLSRNNVITGVPENDWTVDLEPNECLRIEPVDDEAYAVTVYRYESNVLGSTMVARDKSEIPGIVDYLLDPERNLVPPVRYVPNMQRLAAQRRAFLSENLAVIARNQHKSVFFQVDLRDMAHKFADLGVAAPQPIGTDEPLMKQIRDAMFHAQLATLRGQDGSAYEQRAFALLGEGLTEEAYAHRQLPHLDVYRDQIVWGRSAVRIDVAGGWTDTPPYCLNTGGNVVNLAIELNGQQPLQVYVKPCKELKVICRSIDLGATEVLETYDELSQFNRVGSPFSIPKAALALCGFLPQFAREPHATLRDALAAFGSGVEITLLSAIPAGSGLGTSSILAATVLGALSDFCGLGWDKSTICNRTLILEQLLTTGGGWQDQYGGVLHGVKLLQTGAGFDQTPVARWLPDQLWEDPDMRPCHLLYYTGITRTAKQILAEIVRGMFLNSHEHITLLGEMKQQALDMFDAIQRSDINEYGRLVRKTWGQNRALDAGTEPPLVAELCSKIDDLCSGYKLPGAGGGGYLYMVAKDPDAAARIRRILHDNPLTDSSRFVDMRLSKKGLEVSRS